MYFAIRGTSQPARQPSQPAPASLSVSGGVYVCLYSAPVSIIKKYGIVKFRMCIYLIYYSHPRLSTLAKFCVLTMCAVCRFVAGATLLCTQSAVAIVYRRSANGARTAHLFKSIIRGVNDALTQWQFPR